MLTSDLIKELEKHQKEEGDLPVYIWDNVYMEEFELKSRMFRTIPEGKGKKGNSDFYPLRLSIG